MTTPRRILLATDLSARCDRALDRAAALARQWEAQLFAVHALEAGEDRCLSFPEHDLPSWRRGPEPASIAAAHLRRDLSDTGLAVETMVAEGTPADVILAAAAEHRCDLIVTGVARDEVLGRFVLGATVDALLRRSGVPVLAVRQRPRHPYAGIVVAVDVSPASRVALEATAAMFPNTGFHLFHAYEAPLGGMLGDPSAYREAFGTMAREKLDAFLKAENLGAGHILDVLVERGNPADLIPRYVRAVHADLVVLGTQGRGAFLEMLVGSTAKTVLASLDCDALVVPLGADGAA